MKNKLRSAVLGLLWAVLTPLTVQAQGLSNPYQTIPFFLDGQTVPQVMLVLERDWKMFYPAYNNLADLTGDGALDIGFNPEVTYVGYFDSNSCYEYAGSTIASSTAIVNAHFRRVSDTIEQTQADVEGFVPTVIKDGHLSYPASAHGVCSASNNSGTGRWHGNWLNFAMTSRMDAIRKVLYGGYRDIDAIGQTILEMVYLPSNAHVWGGELYADDIWEKFSPSSKWYDISQYTAFARPASGKMHFWARASYYWNRPLQNYSTTNPAFAVPTTAEQQTATLSRVPLFRFVANIPSTNLHPWLKTPLRIWDWVGDHASYGSLPYDGNLAKSRTPNGGFNAWNLYGDGQASDRFMLNLTQVSHDFAARVLVCQNDNFSPTEGCKAYGPNYKPIGLLQQYGESEKMYFGLLTGSAHYQPSDSYRTGKATCRKFPSNSIDYRSCVEGGGRFRGGVVRHHIQPFKNYVNLETGQVNKTGSLIATIDAFTITGFNRTAVSKEYTDATQAGNPVGEMVWEALRYLAGPGTNPSGSGTAYTGAGGLNPSTQYNNSTADTAMPTHRAGTIGLYREPNWGGRPVLNDLGSDCPKPIIMAISEVYPDHDDDDYYNQSDFNSVGLVSTASNNGELPVRFDMDKYLELITEYEGLSTAQSKKQYFYPDDRGLCTAKDLKPGFKNEKGEPILGHCPSEPSLEGTYNIAAVAYYGHTHNFGPLAGEMDLERSVDFYAVGLAGNFPDITLTIDDTRSISLMPFALGNVESTSGSAVEPEPNGKLKTLINFFIQSWETDDGPPADDASRKKVPFRVKFSPNFEFTTTPSYTGPGNSNNWERDIFTTITITLLTTADTPKAYREATPQFINSGPFKTNRAIYLSDRAQGDFTGQTYYYAFKRPDRGAAFDIIGSGFEIAGVAVHSDIFGSGYGAGGLGGYTITGVTFPGAYVDVGSFRADYPLYYRGDIGSTSGSAPGNYSPFDRFVPGPNDEPVPLDPSGCGIPGPKWPGIVGNNNVATNTTITNIHPGTHYKDNGNTCGYYHPSTVPDNLLTPQECPYAGYTNTSAWTDSDLIAAYPAKPNAHLVCGKAAAGYASVNPMTGVINRGANDTNLFRTSLMRYVQVRSFKFLVAQKSDDDKSDDDGRTTAEMKNPLWLAAKYGGFKDLNGNGIPDLDTEWKRMGEGVGKDDPYNYFGVANMSELPTQLGNAFEAIANSVATGTANSASVSQVLGGGVSVQTQYRTEYPDSGDDEAKIIWGGSVYAFFMDKWGNLREDTDGDRKLTLVTSPRPEDWNIVYPDPEDVPPPDYEIGDLIIHTVAPASGTAAPKVYRCRDFNGDNNGGRPLPSDAGAHPTPVSGNQYVYEPGIYCELISSLDEAKALWNAAQKVSDMDVEQRRLYTYLGDYKGNGKEIWQNSPGAGGGEQLEKFAFEAADSSDSEKANLAKLHALMGQASIEETKDLINYIRGTDFPEKYRSRTARLPWDAEGSAAKVWRMGDVINSRPILVGEPNSNFHITYDDQSYAKYRQERSKRRQVAYMGTNDGVLHAVNLGFFGALADGQASYNLNPLDGSTPSPNYELGDEIWGYLPPAVLPHLQWLASPTYQHSYYVDLEPYIVDVKDGDTWRTILLAGLRLGGAPIKMADGSVSTSEFFALDVTDPESKPRLLWRFTHPSLGQTTAIPSVVRSEADGKWFVVLPSGPSQNDTKGQPIVDNNSISLLYEGVSNQKARVIILDVLTGQYARDRDKNPNSDSTPDPLMVEEDNSFFNNSYLPKALNAVTDEHTKMTTWSHHVLYLGLSAEAGGGNQYKSGAVYRLKMVKDNGEPEEVNNWKLTRFFKTDKPVTGAVNSTYDQVGNLWVIFGTGRVWSKKELSPCGTKVSELEGTCVECAEQYIFGLKEPLTTSTAADPIVRLTHEEVTDYSKIMDVSRIRVYENGDLSDAMGGTPSIGATNGLTKFEAFYNFMRDKENPVRGYKRRLETWVKDARNMVTNPENGTKSLVNPHPTVFELINTQVQLDTLANERVNAVVTTYVPSANLCEPLGESYLTLFDAYTGIPAPYMGSYGEGITGAVKGESTEVTATKVVGAGPASEGYVLKTDGGTTYGATGFLGQQPTFKVPEDQSDGSRFISWREVQDMGFDLREDQGALYDQIDK